MILAEVIIRARCHIRSAELAVRTGNDAVVIKEIGELRELLDGQPVLEAGGASEKTRGHGDIHQ